MRLIAVTCNTDGQPCQRLRELANDPLARVVMARFVGF
ncbi:MAG: hypothetical protein JWO22_760 [Frankiales bacterium]|nr:hypothetical protein [Frankiales bacterium]